MTKLSPAELDALAADVSAKSEALRVSLAALWAGMLSRAAYRSVRFGNGVLWSVNDFKTPGHRHAGLIASLTPGEAKIEVYGD